MVRRFFKTLTGRMVTGVLLAHILLLPLLYFAAIKLLTRGYETQFKENVRNNASRLVRHLAPLNLETDGERIGYLLNSFGAGAQTVYIRVVSRHGKQYRWQSGLHNHVPRTSFREDFGLQENGDSIYNITLGIESAPQKQSGRVYIGFDESVVLSYIRESRNNITLISILYVLCLLVFIISLGIHTARPLRELRAAAGAIARGNHNRFEIPSQVEEVLDLAESLEAMRRLLINQRDAAQTANRTKSEFLSHMSHELRTPMNAILGFSQLLKTDENQPLSKEQAENLDEIIRAGKHLLELINEVLDLSRIESGQSIVNKSSFTLLEIMDDCAALMQPLADKQQIRFNTNSEGAARIKLFADPTRLKQVILNLISNAIKYNRAQGAVNFNYELINEQVVQISVTDSGKGLDHMQVQALFQPFERLGAEKSSIEGTGIGLVISKRLIELMDGQIGVDCIPDEGCHFWIALPYQPAKTGQAEPAPVTTHAIHDTPQILYIDDDPAILRLMTLLLERRHYQLMSAHSPFLGIDLAQAHQPDLILLNTNIIESGGPDIRTQLKEHALTQHIPVIAVGPQSLINELRPTGLYDGYIYKPLEVSQFFGEIETVMNLNKNLDLLRTHDINPANDSNHPLN